MACEPLVLVLLAVALLQPVCAYYPLHMPYAQDNSPRNGELHSCGCRTKIKLVGFMHKSGDKLFLRDFCSSVCGKDIIVA